MNGAVMTIKEGLQEIFPDLEDLEITFDTTLADVPDWDSMAAVNLQMYLQDAFQKEIPEELLVGETTINEIVTFVGRPN